MYFGLQTGWISMMSLQSSLLGFVLFKPFHRWMQIRFGVTENVILQTTAVATATMPLAGGFVGIIPALSLLTAEEGGPIVLSSYELILWGLGIAFFGVFFAVPLRKQTIIKEKLRFPSGTATAQMISVLHKKPMFTDEQVNWHRQWMCLFYSFLASGAYTLSSYFFPILSRLPIFGQQAVAWNWFLTPSLSYMGQGIIMGLPTTLAMLVGAIVGWGILSPISYFNGWAPGPIDDAQTGARGWILWVSLAVMISESIVGLFMVVVKELNQRWKSHNNHNENEEDSDDEEPCPPEQLVPSWVTYGGLAFSSILCVVAVTVLFGIPIYATLLSVFLACLLSILAVRALGETDLNPVSGIGKISQVVFAGVIPGGIAANIVAGGIAEAGAQQAGDLMQDMKTGHLLRASPRAQFFGQLIGSFVSVFVAVGAYQLYSSVYSIPGPVFQAPTALVWLDMSRLVNGHPLPPNVLPFILIFGLVFAIPPVLEAKYPHAQLIRYMPSGIAFAIGIYNPPNYTLPRVIGALAVEIIRRWSDRPRLVQILSIVVASGFVLGEGTFAILTLCLKASNM
ncbi:OPT superfamily oligopeptide transporter [Basidiobolus meristosporus CBS 931.73]|uniref:OPT superfamily oligopeptide transporter n=1 Tax=Basidiobolus meristosporus CBS 931.73 TaxID=1314790 RepID=A0A1Y1WDU9_9FUNG|nr:OPT superfamily oligopeptide transporter [Basidiobolus meristosporus CBS 931.73]|eukprot:ORX71701.1 OPT superfamily oligopeptide transporter [Basidiobolus meristosporus CBS 931.73]